MSKEESSWLKQVQKKQSAREFPFGLKISKRRSAAIKKRLITDLLFNNAMFIIIAISVIFIAIKVPAFLSISSIVHNLANGG